MKRDLRIDLSTGRSVTARVLVIDDGSLSPAERAEVDDAVTRAGVTWCGPCRGLETVSIKIEGDPTDGATIVKAIENGLAAARAQGADGAKAE